MTFKRKAMAVVVICILAVLGTALCSCDDLGAYDSPNDYYASFDDVVFLGGDAGDGKEYSVKDYFYNDKSREDFLTREDGIYEGVKRSDYVYVAIPLNKDLNMDSLAMYLQAENDVTIYLSVYITDKIPKNWKKLGETGENGDESSNASADTFEYTSDESGDKEPEYDDPNLETAVGEVTVHLKGGKWNSFILNSFKKNGLFEKSVQLKKGQYILLQIRNNSGVRVLDEKTGLLVDPQTGLVLESADITMTNLLVRAVE